MLRLKRQCDFGVVVMQEVRRLDELQEEYVEDDNNSEDGSQGMRQRY